MDDNGTDCAQQQCPADPTLAHLRRRLEDLTRLVSDWIWETDAEFRLKSASLRVLDALGFHPQLLIGKRLSDIGSFLSPTEQPIALDWRSPFRDVLFVADSQDERKTFLVSGLPYFSETTGKFLGVRGTARDITQNRRIEAALRTSEDRLQLAIEASNDAIWDWNVGNGSVFFSTGWAQRVGLAIVNGHIRIDDWYAAIHDADRENVLRALEHCIPRNLCFEIPEYRVRTAAGGWIWILTRARVVSRDDMNGATRVVGTHRDISDRKKEEEILRIAKEEADLASRAKTEFLANMSHELRTPLNSIIGFSDILANETFGPIGRPEYQEYSRDINDSGRHLLELISDILDVSRIEANGLQLVESACDVARLIGSCIRLVRERALKSEISIERNIPDMLPTLFADERRVRQIILNLLSNAIKFTPRGGKVTVTARHELSGALVIEITDTGIGIADGDLDLVMTPFRQADGSLTRRYDGAGLGLPLSKSLAELHGGTLSLASKLDEGTSATVAFPRYRVLSPITR